MLNVLSTFKTESMSQSKTLTLQKFVGGLTENLKCSFNIGDASVPAHQISPVVALPQKILKRNLVGVSLQLASWFVVV